VKYLFASAIGAMQVTLAIVSLDDGHPVRAIIFGAMAGFLVGACIGVAVGVPEGKK
jgi:hypothetical protein